MSARNGALEFYRILCLFDAHQYHLLCVQGFFNVPPGTWYFTYRHFILSVLVFTMVSLFQIGTLFLIRRPFRLRSLTLFILSIQFYSRSYAEITRVLGYPDMTANPIVRFPIIKEQSWFFTSHVFMTAITPIFHAGMLALSKVSYAMIDLFVLFMLTVLEPKGPLVFDLWPAPGANWMNACLMYFFAGYFGVHGWPLGWVATWILFVGIVALCSFLRKHWITGLVPPQYHWLVLSLQFGYWFDRGKVRWAGGYSRCYTSPLSYVGGIVGLYAMQFIQFPRPIARMFAFLGPKIYVLHFIDSHIITSWQRGWWWRFKERVWTPKDNFLSALSVSLQMAIIGFLLETFKEWGFGRVLAIVDWTWAVARKIREEIRSWPICSDENKCTWHMRLAATDAPASNKQDLDASPNSRQTWSLRI
jgi:hypothetical protein